MTSALSRPVLAEALGSFFLFSCVVGSGIMAERLANGIGAVALLANSIATGAILFVLITALGPISGAHMNPAVSLVATLRRELPRAHLLPYMLAQLGGGILGVMAANLMFGLPAINWSAKVRAGGGLWLAEGIATFGLVLTILLTVRLKPLAVPAAVALYITAAYWFTSSTSFANPAITVARSMSDSFAGIAPASVPAFVLCQLAGALVGALVAGQLERGIAPHPQDGDQLHA